MITDDEWNVLVAASDAVEAAPSPVERREAIAQRNALMVKVFGDARSREPGYLNRWRPLVTTIADATGLDRVHVSRIVNETPVKYSIKKADDGTPTDQP